MAKAKELDRYVPVTLIGTLLDETPYRWEFAPEDDEDKAFWLSKRYAEWEDDEDDYDEDEPRNNEYPREGAMTFPRWIAIKRKCIGRELEDEDPAWLDIARLPRKYFAARWIKSGEIPPKP